MREPISIMLVEDDIPTQKRLSSALQQETGFALVAVAANITDAKQWLIATLPRILITDLKLPDGHGISLIKEARLHSPATEILVISVLGDERSVVAAIRAGACGYLLKDAIFEEIIEAVYGLLQGDSPISASIARYLIRRLQQPTSPRAIPALTDREIEILYGIAKGFSYKDIAQQLGISPYTVPSHIKNIYRKLEVHSKNEAVFVALHHNIIQLFD